MQTRSWSRVLKNTILASTFGLSVSLAHATDTIKVGVLHSLSGTMAISETTLKDTVLMMVEQQNKNGGLLGKKLEAVVVDPASNWPLFAEKTRELLEKEKLDKSFCRSSSFLWEGGPRKTALVSAGSSL